MAAPSNTVSRQGSDSGSTANENPEPMTNGLHVGSTLNGHEDSNGVHSMTSPVNPPAVKKSTKKKAVDPNEGYNLLATRISQLEVDAKDEEEEERAITRAVRKANKELADLINHREDHMAKLETVQQKYSDLYHDMKKLERDYTKVRKRGDQLQKEKDQSKSEVTKTNIMKGKLEQLCRELQKENKRIKDESRTKEKSEKEKREELSTKFEATIWEIKSRMEEENDGGLSKTANMELDALVKLKFRTLVDQYEMREIHYSSLLKTKELEVQYNLARYEQKRKQAEAESLRAKALHAQVSTFSQTETELRSQLNIYVEKFKQVEDTLNNSNDLFLTFRKEMEEMSKKTKRLEKENTVLTRKSELANRNIIEMAEERTRQQREIETAKKKNTKLENLCRALQSERTALENKLRSEEEEYSGEEEGSEEEGEESEYMDSEEEDDEDTEDEGVYDADGNEIREHINGAQIAADSLQAGQPTPAHVQHAQHQQQLPPRRQPVPPAATT